MRGIARHVQVGGDSRGPRLVPALSDGRGADRRGGPVQQAARVGPDGLRPDLSQGEHGRRRVRHVGQSQVCFSGATKRSEQKENDRSIDRSIARSEFIIHSAAGILKVMAGSRYVNIRCR